jgi:Ca2+-binding RTX toxin-like protein
VTIEYVPYSVQFDVVITADPARDLNVAHVNRTGPTLPSKIAVDLNGVRALHHAAGVRQIVYRGGPYPDQFLNNTSLPSVADGGPNVRFLAGTQDHLHGGSGRDVLTITGGVDGCGLVGNGGNDTLTLKDTVGRVVGGAGGDRIDVSFTSDHRRLNLSANILADQDGGVEGPGDGADTVTVRNGNVSVAGGGGDDRIHYTGAFNPVEVWAGGGNDRVIVTASHGEPTVHGGDGNDRIELLAAEGRAVVRAGDGADVVLGVMRTVPLTLDSANDADTIERIYRLFPGDDIDVGRSDGDTDFVYLDALLDRRNGRYYRHDRLTGNGPEDRMAWYHGSATVAPPSSNWQSEGWFV